LSIAFLIERHWTDSGQWPVCLFPGYSVCVGSHRTTRWTAGRDTTAQPTQDRGDPDRPSKLEGAGRCGRQEATRNSQEWWWCDPCCDR